MAGTAEAKKGEEPYSAETRQLLQRAQAGDPAVLSELRELLNARPALWQQLGDLGSHVEEALLGLAAGKSLLARESIRRRMDELRAELAGPAASPVETLLVNRVVICWAQCHLADLEAAQKAKAGQPAAHAERRQAGAQARYLAALKMLTLVRKLARPPLSPLALLGAPIAETAPAPAAPRRDAGLPVCGVGIEN
jgi:hypothetical protein